MHTTEEYSFWCWKHKLPGVLQLLSLLSGYRYSEDDTELILQHLYSTNADDNLWYSHNLSKTLNLWRVALALDEDDRDIVTIKIYAPAEFQERIRFLDLIQSSLKTVEMENN